MDDEKEEAMELNVQQGGHAYRRVSDVDEDTAIVESGKKFIDVFGKVIPWIFGIFALGILAMYISGFILEDVENNENIKEYMIWGILGVSLFASLLGAWAVYKYGVIQDQIDRLKEENEKYDHEISELKQTRQQLGDEVTDLQQTVQDLEHDAQELDEETKEFESLVTELKEIAGENEDMKKLLDNTNKIFHDMKQVVLENERAHLLSTFYDCAFRDDDNRMDKIEYDRFLARLSKKQRKKFTDLGTFETLAGEDKHIDLIVFQDMLEKVLMEVDELLKEEFKNSRR